MRNLFSLFSLILIILVSVTVADAQVLIKGSKDCKAALGQGIGPVDITENVWNGFWTVEVFQLDAKDTIVTKFQKDNSSKTPQIAISKTVVSTSSLTFNFFGEGKEEPLKLPGTIIVINFQKVCSGLLEAYRPTVVINLPQGKNCDWITFAKFINEEIGRHEYLGDKK